MGKLFSDNISFRDGRVVITEEDIQETITTSDTKEFFTDAISEFFMKDDGDADRQWEQLYRVKNSTGSGELLPFRPPDAVNTVESSTGGGGNAISEANAAAETAVGSHGIVFSEVGEGGEILFSRVVSAERFVKNVKYGTAIGYSNEWFTDGQMALIEMTTEDFREAANDKLAAIHYGAIAAAVNNGISTSTALNATGTAGVARIVNTLNDITARMRRAKVRPTHLCIAPENENAINLALKMTVDGGTPQVVQNALTSRLKPLVTEYYASGTGYVVEAKKRLISLNRLPLSLGDFDDLLRDSHTLVGKFRRGILVGEGRVINAFTSIPTTIVSDYDF